MINNQKTNEAMEIFWNAPSDALFNQKTISPVVGFSVKWLEKKRWEGNGIPYLKIGAKCLYRKADVLAWLNQHALFQSTSEYKKHVRDHYPES